MNSAVFAVFVILGVLVALTPSRGAATVDAQRRVILPRKLKLDNNQ